MCNLSQGIWEKGIEQGKTNEARNTAQRMYEKGYAVSDIADIFNRTVKQIESWLGQTMV